MKQREWPPAKPKKKETPYDTLGTWTFSSEEKNRRAMKEIVAKSDLNTGKGHDRAAEAIKAYREVQKIPVTGPDGKEKMVRRKKIKKPLETPEKIILGAPHDEQQELLSAEAVGHMQELADMERGEEVRKKAQEEVDRQDEFEEQKAIATSVVTEQSNLENAVDLARFVAERKSTHEQMWAEQIGHELNALEEISSKNQQEAPAPNREPVPAVLVSENGGAVDPRNEHGEKAVGRRSESVVAQEKERSYWDQGAPAKKETVHHSSNNGGGEERRRGFLEKTLNLTANTFLVAGGFLLLLLIKLKEFVIDVPIEAIQRLTGGKKAGGKPAKASGPDH